MWTVPDFSPVVLSKHRYPSCNETELIVILTLTIYNIMEMGMNLLHKVLRGNQAGLKILIIPQFMEQNFYMVVLK